MTETNAGTTSDPTVAQYLAAHGVEVATCTREEASRLGLAVPTPAGWQSTPVEQFPGTTDVLIEPNMVENGFAPNAVLIVGKLSSPVDVEALLNCSFADARVLPGWTELEANFDDLGPWPSRFIRGTFEAEQLNLAVTTRYAIAGEDRNYLVQLTVTVLTDQMDKLAFDVSTMNDGVVSIDS